MDVLMKPGTSSPKPAATSGSACAPDDVRCLCGQLLARLVENGVELKCKRCRRLVTIPLSRIRGMPR
ncbi:protein of unknown function [Candidatus Nitrospira inopinata]|jgi:hypothetical protein|uniref:Com family DNA-binding transcriptional regulator n=2 Tax=Candidatus Nitrospira inopinata TaxID=1715989 RepID=A0A0S4KR87_9BACT|nr:protein of unknown function [Candidatus Nitrospira inopinata]